LSRTYLIKQEKPYTEIDPNDIELIESIGAGSYGSGIFSNFPLGMITSSIDRYHENVCDISIANHLKIYSSFQSEMEVKEYRSGC